MRRKKRRYRLGPEALEERRQSARIEACASKKSDAELVRIGLHLAAVAQALELGGSCQQGVAELIAVAHHQRNRESERHAPREQTERMPTDGVPKLVRKHAAQLSVAVDTFTDALEEAALNEHLAPGQCERVGRLVDHDRNPGDSEHGALLGCEVLHKLAKQPFDTDDGSLGRSLITVARPDGRGRGFPYARVEARGQAEGGAFGDAAHYRTTDQQNPDERGDDHGEFECGSRRSLTRAKARCRG